MPELFLGSQICEMAIETEKKGAAFYDAVASAAKTREVRDFCLRMAAAEREHEATFKAMLSSLAHYSPAESYPGEYVDYVHALLERDVMPAEEAGKRLAAGAESERDAVDFAIQFEKSTILFLQEMRNFVPQQQRPAVDKLIEEERSHVTGLVQLRNTLRP
jgi:rubrerythrin